MVFTSVTHRKLVHTYQLNYLSRVHFLYDSLEKEITAKK